MVFIFLTRQNSRHASEKHEGEMGEKPEGYIVEGFRSFVTNSEINGTH